MASAAPSPDPNLDAKWEKWKKKFEKIYSPDEERHRRAVWEETKKKIEAHNAGYKQGKTSFYMGLNQFSDLTPEEFRRKCCGSSMCRGEMTGDLPEPEDLGENNSLTPGRDQGRKCRYHAENSAANVRDFVQIPGSKEALMKAVAKVGPISVAVDDSHGAFQFYDSGIYYEPQCKTIHLNHAVLVIGYSSEGEESDGNSYWLVKNSWSEEWGMKGYMKIAKDWNNHCGIATFTTYPMV
ncbi:testin-2-like [Arvicanthis niloticus]|uniref:testin-2-like n=1 Tax=Arvicanthis niloticus TaxID=61156 RepID=UPI001485EB6F|nr:testin-2-like [Arvicanthis niloticus]